MTNVSRCVDRPGINTRHRAYNFEVPRVTGQATATFYYNAIKDWNNLPDNLKAIPHLLSFKPKLKLYMQEEAVARSVDQYMYF